MPSNEFLLYALPNQEVVCFEGIWRPIQGQMPSGFIVSDAHGQHFWRFEEGESISIDEVVLPNLEDKQIQAISEIEYTKNCKALIAEMQQNNVDKVVFSRIKKCDWSNDKFKHVFNDLIEAYPGNLNYAFFSDQLGFWMGSTPEVLVQSQGENYTSMALAGTLGTSESDDMWTQKEFDEQQYVSDYLSNLLGIYGQVEYKSTRYVHQVGPVKHLRNDFEFSMNPMRLWDFIRDFHPTPAVCGVPKIEALHLYQKHETHQRELYTGIIGLKIENCMNLFVNLRCMQIFGDTAVLYVGGGLTQDSNAHKEWLETERKSQALGRFLR